MPLSPASVNRQSGLECEPAGDGSHISGEARECKALLWRIVSLCALVHTVCVASCSPSNAS